MRFADRTRKPRGPGKSGLCPTLKLLFLPPSPLKQALKLFGEELQNNFSQQQTAPLRLRHSYCLNKTVLANHD